MAVETNKGDAAISPTQTLTGMAAAALNGKNRRKRPSSLMSTAGSLPSVESSLDEFISRANQTLTDPDQWNAAEVAAKQQDSDQREQDQQRWRAAEHQLREGEAREQSLRRQLDGLQGRLAEAEARAAVAGSGSQDGVIADLKMRLTRADERIQAAEYHASQADQRATQLTGELSLAKTEARPSAQFFNQGDSDERIRLAEAKASKALAIARAASAGLTVSQADISAIESGLVVSDMPQSKGTNWLAVGGAFIGGLAIMFGVSKAIQKDPAPVAAAAQPAPTEQAVAPAPAPTPKPTVTPIEDNNAPVKAAEAAADQPKVDPIPVPAPVPVADKAAPQPKHQQAAAVQPKHQQAAAPAKKQPPAAAKSNGGIADPFGDSTPAKGPAKKAPADKKPAGGIADPFGN
jgi:hypothetical protein